MEKKWSSALSALILLSISLWPQSAYAQAAPIVLKFDIPEPKIAKNIFTFENLKYDLITVKSLDKYGAPGKPVMPFKTVRILIPQDSDLENIEITTGKKITLDGRYRIEYGKTPVPLSRRFDSIPLRINQVRKSIPLQRLFLTNCFHNCRYRISGVIKSLS